MLAFLLTISTLADPQTAAQKQGLPQPIEQGVGDVNPLSQSQRVLPVDLYVPTRFEKVYKLEDVIRRGDALRSTPSGGGFVRFSGGVAAVFPFSTYEPTARGNVATIPAGTVFHLDLRPTQPSDLQFDAGPTAPAYNAVQPAVAPAARARSLSAPSSPANPATLNPTNASVTTRRDPAPRGLLVRPDMSTKLDRAAGAEGASAGGAPAASPEASPSRTQRLTPWSEGALRERVLDALVDEMVGERTSAAPSVLGTR